MVNISGRDNGIFIRYIMPAFIALYSLGTSNCYSGSRGHAKKPVLSKTKKAAKAKGINAPEAKDLERIAANEPDKEQKRLDFLNDFSREAYLKDKDAAIMALTLYGESAGQPYEFRKGVANVILNRAEQKGRSIEDVVLQPWQFSCYNKNDPNRVKIRNISKENFKKYFNEAKAFMENREDNTGRATHYYNARQERNDLIWSRGKTPTVVIPCNNGTNGYFYRNIKY